MKLVYSNPRVIEAFKSAPLVNVDVKITYYVVVDLIRDRPCYWLDLEDAQADCEYLRGKGRSFKSYIEVAVL